MAEKQIVYREQGSNTRRERSEEQLGRAFDKSQQKYFARSEPEKVLFLQENVRIHVLVGAKTKLKCLQFETPRQPPYYPTVF